MTFSSFGRLARLYHERMMRLFHGEGFDELVSHPELVNDPAFRQAAWKVARGMVREVARANATSWRQAAAKATRAKQIYQALRSELERTGIAKDLERIAARNADLIRSVPADVARRITRHAAELEQAGKRPEEVARAIRKLAPELTRGRVRLIARTEVSRAETDVTRARAELLGIRWYAWQTSEDSRVRPSHRIMDGVLVAWNDPPSPEKLIGERSNLGHYHSGQAPNCRCVALPLVDLDEVKWPAKVFRAGRIVRMTRAEFTRAIGMPLAA